MAKDQFAQFTNKEQLLNIKPLFDRVVIRRAEMESAKTASGIVLPGSALEIPNHGTVVAIGPGRVLDNGDVLPMTTKVGDVVTFGLLHANTFIKHEGEDLIVMPESDIIAILS